MPRGLYFFVGVALFGMCCTTKLSTDIENSVPYFYMPYIHSNADIFRCDSLAWAYRNEQAIEHFENLIEKYSGNTLNYINYRILSLKSEIYINDSVLYKRVIESKNNDPNFDYFKKLAICDYTLSTNYRNLDIQSMIEYDMDKTTIFYEALWKNKIGEYYLLSDQMHIAKIHIGESAELLSQLPKYSLVHLDCFSKMVDCNISKRELELAKIYALKGVNFNNFDFIPDPIIKTRQYNKIAYLCLLKKEKSSALAYIWTAQKNIKSYPCTKESHGAMFNSFLYCFTQKEKNNLEKLYKSLEKQVKDCSIVFEDWHQLMAIFTNSMYDTNKAIPYFDASVAQQMSLPKPDYLNFTSATYGASMAYANIGQYEKALQTMALSTLQVDEYDFQKFIDIHADPNNTGNGFIGLQTAAELYFTIYSSTNNIEYLKKCELLIDAAYNVMFRQMKVLSESSLLKFNDDAVARFFDLAMNTYYTLYTLEGKSEYYDKYLQISNQSRNNIMTRDINAQNYDDPLIQEETRLKIQLKKLMLDNKALSPEAVELQEKYHKILSDINQKSHVYQSLFELNSKIDLQNIHLDSTTSILQLDILNDKVIVNIISNDSRKMYGVTYNEEIENTLEELLKTLVQGNKISPNDYASLSMKITNWLFPNDEYHMLKKKIHFIPDDMFHYLSPDILVLKNTCAYTSFTELPLLGDAHDVTYRFKMLNKTQKSIIKNPRIAVFAFSDQSTIKNKANQYLPEISGSYSEAYYIKKQFPPSQIFSGKQATKENFLKIYRDSTIDIIHLSVHGISNDKERENVKLYFRLPNGGIDSLKGGELMGIKSKTKVIVLSACQSAKGKIQNGEGIYSLPRFFIINGAEVVMASLWNLDDAYGAQFYKMFYEKMATEGQINVGSIAEIKTSLKNKYNVHPHYIYPTLVCSR